MFATRKIARELLPLVVIAWATFVILGGALKAVERGGSPDEGAAMSAGLGLCAVSVAAVFVGTGLVKRFHHARRAFVAGHRGKTSGLFAPPRPMAYMRPPPELHPLQISQVFRT
jgi:hypothetical protein